jgi:predicted permease
VAVISDSAWQRLFGSDPGIAGRDVMFNGIRFTILGVAGRDFGGTDPQVPDVWIPLTLHARLVPGDDRLDDKRIFWLDVAGRLKPTVTVENAAAETGLLVNRASKEYLDTEKHVAVSVVHASFLARPDERARVTSIAMVAFGAVTLVLLIACANVANLMLAKALEREREIAVRISLGASRIRLIRQLLTESIVISLMGGAAGLLLAIVLPDVLVRLLQPPTEQQIDLHLTLNLSLMAYGLLLSLGTGLMVGLAPARQAWQTGQLSALKGGGSFLPSFSRASLRNALVVGQISLCLVLVMSAALLVRALQAAITVDPGFETKHVIVCDLTLQRYGYNEAQAEHFFQQLQQELTYLPGIQTSSVASLTPLAGISISAPIMLQDSPPSQDAAPSVNYHVVSASYFDALSIPLVRGRLFQQDDVARGTPVAVINEAMAQRYWPGQDALGKRFRPGPPSIPIVEVAGIVRNARLGRLWEDAQPYFFLPSLSTARGPSNQTSRLRMKLLVRTSSDAAGTVTTISRLIQRIDPALRPSVERLEKNVDRWLWFSRVGATLATVLGVIALVLALVGIASVAFFDVARRHREIGIRLAIGATGGDIQRWVLRRGVMLVLCGVTTGLFASAILSRLLSAFLYSVSPLDPSAFTAVSIIMMVTAFLGNYLPARKASTIAPTEALRNQ